jgi:isoquinoline 1-oxidoreductase
VCWTRAEEFVLDTFRPAASISIASTLNNAGRIDSWAAHVYGAGEGGAAPFYDIPNQRVVVYGDWQNPTPGQHPFGVGAWRAPACCSNAFARERHIDGMAHALGVDPLEFRLRHLTDLRMARVIQAGARRFGWPMTTARARGVGMACGIYSNTYLSTFAHVEADRSTGSVRVLRLTCAQDMGQVVNPNGAMAQIEGALTMGLGYALTEEVRFEGGRIEDQNFDTYHVPRFSTLPAVEAVLVEASDLPASAGGEPAVMCVGAAIGNAIFDAIGADLRQMPMTPSRVREAVSS